MSGGGGVHPTGARRHTRPVSRPRVPLASPDLGPAGRRYLDEVLASGRLVQGPFVARFEHALATRTDRRHAIAVSSGTAALELALRVLGVGPGDEVLVPDLTWPSPAHAAALLGATPVLVDVDPATWNATPEAFRAGRTPRTRCAVVVHQFGAPADVPGVVAALPGVAVVEDAACAIGSTLRGRPAGNLGGAVACLSFHPRKVVTTGEGGACLTDDEGLARRLRTLRNHGQEDPGVFAEAGPNARLGEVGAALGLDQLERLDEILAARRAAGERYRAGLPPGLRAQALLDGAATNVQTFGVVLQGAGGAARRDRLIAGMRDRGIEAGRLSYALHRLPSLRGVATVPPGGCPVSGGLVDGGLALPVFPGLSEEDQTEVLRALAAVLPERMLRSPS